MTPPLMVKPRAAIACCKRTTSGPLSPNFGNVAGAEANTGEAEADVVLKAIPAAPKVLDIMMMAIALRRFDPFMSCSLDLLAV